MKKGTFNKIIRLGNVVLKLSTERNSISNEMLRLDAKDIKKYEGDIKNVGINTSKVYLSWHVNDKNIIIQEFINGKTVQEYLDSDDISSKDKLILFKRIIEMYKLSLSNVNLCLDWNLNNFIIKDDEIYYVDYVPALYKDKIKSVDSDILSQYQLSLVDKQIQLAGIVSYAIVPFFNESKDELMEVYHTMKKTIETILNVDMNSKDNLEHVYIKKLIIIEEYLNNSMDKQTFLKKYNSISMMKTAYQKVIK